MVLAITIASLRALHVFDIYIAILCGGFHVAHTIIAGVSPPAGTEPHLFSHQIWHMSLTEGTRPLLVSSSLLTFVVPPTMSYARTVTCLSTC